MIDQEVWRFANADTSVLPISRGRTDEPFAANGCLNNWPAGVPLSKEALKVLDAKAEPIVKAAPAPIVKAAAAPAPVVKAAEVPAVKAAEAPKALTQVGSNQPKLPQHKK